MIKVKMNTKEGLKEFPAWYVLGLINDTEFISVLKAIKWETTGKKDFLTGKVMSGNYSVGKPLTESEATQAVEEYYKERGINK